MPFVVVTTANGSLRSGNTTHGHRFMAPAEITVRRFDDYVPALERAKVVLDPARRRDIILHDARTLAMAQGLDLVEDEGLLAEVAGLVEWPVVLMGEFEAAFLDIPPEVIRATIRANQKCFVLRESGQKARKRQARQPLRPRRQYRGVGRRRRDRGAATPRSCAPASPTRASSGRAT